MESAIYDKSDPDNYKLQPEVPQLRGMDFCLQPNVKIMP